MLKITIKKEGQHYQKEEITIEVDNLEISEDRLVPLIKELLYTSSVDFLPKQEIKLEFDENPKEAYFKIEALTEEQRKSLEKDSCTTRQRRLPKLKHFYCCEKHATTIEDVPKCRYCGKIQTFEQPTIFELDCKCGSHIVGITSNRDMKNFICGKCKEKIEVEFFYKENKIKNI